ncbi:hypothetical protein HZS_1249 [Henneguya salminicola]|nr:hypothetical protein HZS_1249 [Henneguya salminicola]
MIESAQINFCITAIRSYTNNILKLKLLKRSKYDEIREKITGIKSRMIFLNQDILDKSTEKTKEPPLSHNVSTKTMQTYCYEILLFVLESDSPELLASTLECLQKLISYNYLTEIFSQIKDNCTYLVHFMTKLLSIFKQHPTNENINLAIVMVILKFIVRLLFR